MRRIDRYLIREVAGPVTLGFLVYTFILLTNFLFRSAEMIIVRDVPASQIGQLLFLSLPNIIVLTIPMSFLFGALVAMGRLSADSELVALRSTGQSLWQLARPVLLVSLLLTLFNTFLMVWALPRANHQLTQLRLDIITRSATQQVEPRVFYEEWEGLILYVFEVPPESKRWHGVFLAEDLPGDENQITIAEWGEVRYDEATEQLVLYLEGVSTYTVDFSDPEKHHHEQLETLQQPLQDRLAMQQGVTSVSKSVRELTIPELRERAEKEGISDELRNLCFVEIHKKFAIPAACLVFGILALPLGSNRHRGGKSSGFAVSIGIIMLYYILLSNGEEYARVGKLSAALAMWLPNIIMAAMGLLLLWRKNRDRTLLPVSADRWMRNRTWLWRRSPQERRRKRSPASRSRTYGHGSGGSGSGSRRSQRPNFVVRLPRLRSRFPTLMDRYVARVFLRVFGLTLLSCLMIYLIADLTDNAEDIFRSTVSSDVVFDYYKYLSLQILYEIAPIAVLVTTLITFGVLSRSNEVTAAKALGISLYRLAIPAVLLGILVSTLASVVQSNVLPGTNLKAARLKERIKERPVARTYRRADRQWLFGQGRYIYNYLRYDEGEQRLDRLQVFEFTEDYKLSARLFAGSAKYQPERNSWLFDETWKRRFEQGVEAEFEAFPTPVEDAYPETPDYFESEFKPPDAMSYAELKEHIAEVEESGQQVPKLKVSLHGKISYPFISFVMLLVALPFAFRLERKGALYGVGIGVILGIVFMAFYALCSTFGEIGALHPLVAVWSPNIAFSLLALYLFLGVRT